MTNGKESLWVCDQPHDKYMKILGFKAHLPYVCVYVRSLTFPNIGCVTLKFHPKPKPVSKTKSTKQKNNQRLAFGAFEEALIRFNVSEGICIYSITSATADSKSDDIVLIDFVLLFVLPPRILFKRRTEKGDITIEESHPP